MKKGQKCPNLNILTFLLVGTGTFCKLSRTQGTNHFNLRVTLQAMKGCGARNFFFSDIRLYKFWGRINFLCFCITGCIHKVKIKMRKLSRKFFYVPGSEVLKKNLPAAKKRQNSQNIYVQPVLRYKIKDQSTLVIR